MALWQVSFYLIETEDVDFEDITLWKKQVNVESLNISFLERNLSWNASIIQYGKSDETCIEIMINDNRQIEEISVKLDLRSVTKTLLYDLLDLIGSLGKQLYYNGRIYSADINSLLLIIRTSDAFRFCSSPKEYFEQL